MIPRVNPIKALPWRASLLLLALVFAGCSSRDVKRLPTGAVLDPAGPSVTLGSMPVAMVFSPDSSRIVAVLSGYRDQGFQVIDVATKKVVQTVVQPSAFLGAVFSPDGRSLYVSGGNQDVVYRYRWLDNAATLVDSIALGPPPPDSTGGRSYPARLACSPDGSHLYVAENLADSLAVIDLAAKRVVQRLAVGPYPYGVIAARDGSVYVSAWGGEWIAHFVSQGDALALADRIPAGRHPSAMALDGH